MKRNITREWNKTQERHGMHNAIAELPQINAPASDQPLLTNSSVYILSMTFYGMEYPFG